MSDISGISFNSSSKLPAKSGLKKSPKYHEDPRTLDPESQIPLLKPAQ